MKTLLRILPDFSLIPKRPKRLNQMKLEKLLMQGFQLGTGQAQQVTGFDDVLARLPCHLDFLGIGEVELPPLTHLSVKIAPDGFGQLLAHVNDRMAVNVKRRNSLDALKRSELR